MNRVSHAAGQEVFMRALRQQVGAGLIVAMLAGPGAMGAESATIAAVWKEQKIDFVYFGRTSRYTCDGMRDKLRAILGTMGVRRDISAVAVGCAINGEPRELRESSPTVHLVFSSPALPDASAKPAHPGDLLLVDAQFEAFSIATDAFRNMQPGDCELVEEFVRQILPKLTTRNVQSDVTCIPYQLSGSHYAVRGEVLRPLPAH
jgi:hypothetical protein